ncbi:MAG: hypothetical protein ACTSSE_19290 [Candidatus Thorarchaeota archaeon]|jgi:hypothetical protein
MAWEVWTDTDSNRSYGQMGFFCNTVDESFGPVCMTDSYFDRGQFYKLWEQAGFQDPRSLHRSDDSCLRKNARHIIKLMSWEDNILATMKVYRADEVNAPVLIFEKTEKSSFDSLSFSAFEEPLEALSEDDFDTVNELIEIDCNDMMKNLILTEDPHDDDKESSVTSAYKGYKVVMEWEVLDEY